VFMLERHQIEGRSAEAIARDLVGAFEEHCQSSAVGGRGAPDGSQPVTDR